MNRANGNVIDSKSVLMSLLADPENAICNQVHDEKLTHLSVTLLKLRCENFAVCDKSMEGSYVTYLYEDYDEQRAMDAFAACVQNFDTDD